MIIHNLNKFPKNYEYKYGDLEELGEYEIENIKKLPVDEVWYWYASAPYEGSGQMLMRKDELYDIAELSHCSCYGPTDDLSFEGETLTTLKKYYTTEKYNQFEELLAKALNIPKEYGLLNDDPVIRTFSGKWVNVFDIDPDTIDIVDIAHALAFQCRFGGHLSQFYSVAQHSIWCYQEAKNKKLSKNEQLAALMHDASEAFLVDIPRPIKKELKEYKSVEDGVMNVIAKKYGFKYPLSPDIKQIDGLALEKEWDYLKIKKEGAEQIHIYSQEYSEKLFLDIFKSLL